jgi:putative ABC transport system permease protein
MIWLAIAALRQRLMRNALAGISVAIAVAVVTVTAALIFHLETIVAVVPKDQLSTFPLFENAELPIKMVDAALQVPGVKRVLKRQVGFGGNDGAHYHFLVACEEEGYLDVHGPEGWFIASSEVRERWKQERDGAIVHASTMQKMGWHVGDAVTLRTVEGDLPVRVSGEAIGESPGNVLIHRAYIDEQRRKAGRPSGTVNAVVTQIDDPSRAAEIAPLLDQKWAEEGAATFSMSRIEQFRMQAGAESPLVGFLVRISIVVVLVTMLITITTLVMALRERRLELATLRAIGFKRGKVVRLIVAEMVFLCLVAGLLGAGIPFALYHTHGLQMGRHFFNHVRVEPLAFGMGVGLSAGLGLFSSLIPALLTARLNPLEMMRGE